MLDSQELLNSVSDLVARWADDSEEFPEDGDHADTLWRVAAWLRDEKLGPLFSLQVEGEMQDV